MPHGRTILMPREFLPFLATFICIMWSWLLISVVIKGGKWGWVALILTIVPDWILLVWLMYAIVGK
jgi:Na+-driven multidrug efflux pump